MKKALFTLIRVCLIISAVFTELRAQTCSFSEARLTSQSEVKAFSSSCKTVKGNITIIGADITDLTPLENIEVIDGTLKIQNNTHLTSLTGLEKLTSTKHLLIYTNDLLEDLTGLEGLTSVTSLTHIRYNKNLLSLKGLNNLTTASTFYITDNDLLPDLTGLSSLESVTDLLAISTNKSLTSLNGLTSLTAVSRINIGDNDLLTDLSGLETLVSVSYQMNILLNDGLMTLNGLDNLTYMSELYITDNDSLPDLTGLEVIGGVKWLVVGENPSLTSLTGLNNLNSATNLIIRNNPLLTDLSGLENITNIGWMQVIGNAGLLSLSGLGSGTSGERIGSNERIASLSISTLLSMKDNPKLTTCAISAVCDFIKVNSASISGNGSGCNSETAVESACSSLPVTLASFTAIAENRTALVQWATAEERNSSVFEVEHSLDARTWQKIGENVAKGQSNKLVNYQWVHTAPDSGLNYYRLKMIDLDGSYAYSRIVNLRLDGIDQVPVFIYPNPASDILFIENKEDVVRLRIINLQGKTVYETSNAHSEELSVKELAKGQYQVQITRRNGAVQAHRVVIL